jgi:hypothetical protein
MVNIGPRKKVVMAFVKGLTPHLNERYEETCQDSQYPS